MGEKVYRSNANSVKAPRPGLGVVVNHGNGSWLTVLVLTGRFSLEGEQDGVFIRNPETGELLLVGEPLHHAVLGPSENTIPKVPTEYWLWLHPKQQYTFALVTLQGLLFPRIADMRMAYIYPKESWSYLSYAQYRSFQGMENHFVSWKVDVTGLDMSDTAVPAPNERILQNNSGKAGKGRR